MSIGKFFLHTKTYNWNRENNVVLLTKRNVKKILHSVEQHDCHSSIEDLTLENVLLVLDKCKEIHILDFTSECSESDAFQNGRVFYQLFKCREKVYNFDLTHTIELDNLDLLEKQTHRNPILWSFGCSVAMGIGVKPNQKYSALLSEKLDLPIVDKSFGGTSIKYAADKILRSDIKQGDIVIWGLTSVARFEYAEGWEYFSATASYMHEIDENMRDVVNISNLDGMTHILSTIHAIAGVINFCEKIGAKLYIANILDCSWIPVIFRNKDFFIDFVTTDYQSINEFIDRGTDNLHPGPLQHQQFADKLYNLIKGNKHGKTI